jgi:hypothetical protein
MDAKCPHERALLRDPNQREKLARALKKAGL